MTAPTDIVLLHGRSAPPCGFGADPRPGRRIALAWSAVESIVDDGDGCTIVTKSDTYRVTASYDEAVAKVWPERKALPADED
jgi:hypothetical protein